MIFFIAFSTVENFCISVYFCFQEVLHVLTDISLIPQRKAVLAMREHVSVHCRWVLSFDTWPISSFFSFRNKFMDLPLSNDTLLCSPIYSTFISWRSGPYTPIQNAHQWALFGIFRKVQMLFCCCTQLCSWLYQVYVDLAGRGGESVLPPAIFFPCLSHPCHSDAVVAFVLREKIIDGVSGHNRRRSWATWLRSNTALPLASE